MATWLENRMRSFSAPRILGVTGTRIVLSRTNQDGSTLKQPATATVTSEWDNATSVEGIHYRVNRLVVEFSPDCWEPKLQDRLDYNGNSYVFEGLQENAKGLTISRWTRNVVDQFGGDGQNRFDA